jgi:hypothetical protein
VTKWSPVKGLCLVIISPANRAMESTVNLDACLPEELRGPGTTITPIAMGLSGAGVYRVERADQVFVLKISDWREFPTAWQRKRHMRQLAAEAGLAPRVVGENLLLLDWDTAAPNDPYYDLAALSVFLRMDEATCEERRCMSAPMRDYGTFFSRAPNHNKPSMIS